MLNALMYIPTVIKSGFAIYNWNRETTMELTGDVSIATGLSVDGEFISTDEMIHVLPDGVVKIKKGYKWNGCSNVPDGMLIKIREAPVKSKTAHNLIPISWKASLLHDAMYDILIQYPMEAPFTRKDADTCLRYQFQVIGDPIKAWVYYFGLRAFGGKHIRNERKKLK